MVGIAAALSMAHEYNTRAKKRGSALTSECLQNLEDNIIKNIHSVKDSDSVKRQSLNGSKKIMKNYQRNVENFKTDLILLKLLLIP